jgi:hypothetical protein
LLQGWDGAGELGVRRGLRFVARFLLFLVPLGN